jgi:hypothetical protein
VVKGTVDGEQRGWVLDRSNDEFRGDLSSESPLSDEDLRAIAEVAGQELTYTAVPPGSGERAGVDRDLDTYLDGDEILGGSDPADPGSTPP